MTVKGLLAILNKLAFNGLAEDWDNVGLQVGDPESQISGCLLGIDVTRELVNHAVETGLNTVIAHHPLIFKPIKNVISDNPTGSLIGEAVKNNINIISLHTNLDMVDWGVSNALAKYMGLLNIQPLRRSSPGYLFKLVVFVPGHATVDVRDAICKAGGGVIGDYSFCTFSMSGEGTFLGGESTDPYIGKSGKLEKVEELRLEVLVEKNILSEVVAAMIKAHPYEEVAYDIYRLENTKEYGIGKIGDMENGKTVGEIAKLLGESPLIGKAGIIGDKSKRVSRVAVCGGSAGSVLNRAIKQADLLVCGELGHHLELEAAESELNVIVLGHAPSEAFILDVLRKKLQTKANSIRIDVYNKLFDGPKWEYYE